MSSISTGALFVGAAMLAAAVPIAAPGHAATLIVTSVSFDAGSRSGLVTTSYVVPVAVTAGRYDISGYDAATNAGFSYDTYGYDLIATLSGGTYTTSTLTAAGVSAVKQSQINALIANTQAIATTPDTSAAVQLAIWELLNESSAGYSLSGGSFAAGASLSTARGLANTYLGNVTSNIWKSDASYSVGLLTSGLKQDQIYWTTTQPAVPEPASWAMFIAGFGLIGAVLRRRPKADGIVA